LRWRSPAKTGEEQVERAQVTENIGMPPRFPSITGASAENKALAAAASR